MAQPYVGEIRIFAGNFAPAGWMFCEGQLLPISENETLFQLIGTTYGGDGQDTFGLPDLRGRVPVHVGSSSAGTSYQLAQADGVEDVTLTAQQLPVHSHPLAATRGAGTSASPSGRVLADPPTQPAYVEADPDVSLSFAAVTDVGGGQAHTNLQPYLCVHFIISLFGIFPSPT